VVQLGQDLAVEVREVVGKEKAVMLARVAQVLVQAVQLGVEAA
jgi:hypothetical protein